MIQIVKSASSLRVNSKNPLKLNWNERRLKTARFEFLLFEKRIKLYFRDGLVLHGRPYYRIRPRFQFYRYSLNMASLDKDYLTVSLVFTTRRTKLC